MPVRKWMKDRVACIASKPAPTGGIQRLKMGVGQAQRVGRAVFFVLVVEATVAAVHEVRLVREVLGVELELQVLGQRVAGAEINKGLRIDIGVNRLDVYPGQFV